MLTLTIKSIFNDWNEDIVILQKTETWYGIWGTKPPPPKPILFNCWSTDSSFFVEFCLSYCQSVIGILSVNKICPPLEGAIAPYASLDSPLRTKFSIPACRSIVSSPVRSGGEAPASNDLVPSKKMHYFGVAWITFIKIMYYMHDGPNIISNPGP